MKKTKIICSIGPVSRKYDVMKSMIENGMNVARINFSHADEIEKKETVNENSVNLKQVDGGKYKITGTKRAYRVDKGETIRTIAQQIYGSKGYAPYIIAHNNLKNPDNINAGVVIKLLELVRR
jgi:hypothetical protein